MFGNRFGWGISAAIAVVLGLIVWMFVKMDTISKPSTGAISRGKPPHVLELPSHPEMLEEIKLPFDPASVVPTMTKSGDAGPLYRQAMAEAEKSPAKYRESARIKRDNLDEFPALKPLVEAKDVTTMNLFGGRPEEVISYKLQPEPIMTLEQLGVTAGLVAFTIKDAQKEQALA